MATFHFDLVSPEKLAFSGEVDQVDVPGIEGDFGVLAGHAPVVAVIRPGILTVTAGGTQHKIIMLGGLAEVSDKGLTVLADVATSVQDLDRDFRRQLRAPLTVAGAVVTKVADDSNSATAGLRLGDVIVEINQQPVAGAKDAQRLGKSANGEQILIKVWRPNGDQGSRRYLSVNNTRRAK